jgi:hypothetical protein
MAAGLAILLLAGGTGTARAEGGERMVRILCDANSNLVTIEPFMLWRGVLRPGQEGLGDAGRVTDPALATASDYRLEDLATSAASHDCAMAVRQVTVTGEGQAIRVTETIGDGPASTFSFDLGDSVFSQLSPRKSTWHPIASAAPFWVESRAPGQWFECRTVASSDDALCEAIGLSSAGSEVLTMAPMQSEPMPVAPMGWLSSTAEPLGPVPPGRSSPGLRPGPNGPMLN